MAKITSIDDRAAKSHIQTAPERRELPCSMTAGFHLVKVLRSTKDANGNKVKAPAGTWRFRYTNAAGKVRIATIGRYPEMTHVRAATIARQYRAGLPEVDPLEEEAKLKEEAKQREQEKQQRQFATVRGYLDGPYMRQMSRRRNGGRPTKKMIESAFADWLDLDIEKLDRQLVLSWQLKHERDGKRYSSIKRFYSAIQALLNHAVKEEVIAANPLKGVALQEATAEEKKRIATDKEAGKRRMLTPEEISLIRDGLERLPSSLDVRADPVDWFKPLVILAMHTGLRPGDLRSLVWGDELNIQFKRLTKVPGKTLDHPDPAKVVIPLQGECLDIMRDWYARCGKPDGGLVFQTPRGAMISQIVLNRTWNKLRNLTGLEPELYSTRHHFISTLVANNVPLFTVAKLAGHKSTQMIEKHYGHLAPHSAAKALELLGQSLMASPGKGSQAAN